MKTSKKLIAGLAMTLLVYPLAYAQSLKNQELERQGFELSKRLKQLISQNLTNRCAGDISTAVSYIERAAQDLAVSKRNAALTAIAYGQNELKEISKNRAYCAHLATRIQPYVEQVSSIKRELEREPFPEEDIPDSCLNKDTSK